MVGLDGCYVHAKDQRSRTEGCFEVIVGKCMPPEGRASKCFGFVSERYRQRKAISTGFTESAVNQVVSRRFVKKQQMRWSERGAHLLLQIRARVLNGHWRATLSRWYPAMKVTPETKAA